MLPTLLHIGYPKAGSTWLQRYFFGKHEELFHLGKNADGSIIDDDLRLVLWSDIVEKPSFLFDSHDSAKKLNQYRKEAAENGAKYISVSSEVTTNFFVGNVDIKERAHRVKKIFGEHTRILLVLRNQLDWIVSMYAGLIKEGGLARTFEEFLFHFYYYQDRSALSSLYYDKVVEEYQTLFGKENVVIIPFELLKESNQEFLDTICDNLGISRLSLPKEHLGKRENTHNKSLSPQALYYLYKQNLSKRIYLGGDRFQPAWSHATQPVFNKFGIQTPAYVKEDWRILMENAKKAFSYENSKWIFNKKELNATIPEHYKELLIETFKKNNRKVSELAKLELKKFGYPT